MKIESPNSTAVRAGRRAAAGGNARTGDGFASLLAADAAAESGHAAPAPASVASSALLAIQEVSDEQPRPQRRKPAAAAASILDRLDRLRLALLSGTLDRTTLEQLKAATRLEIDQASDPAIAEILGEIELRAAVELAKYGL